MLREFTRSSTASGVCCASCCGSTSPCSSLEFGAGLVAHSTALLADSVDMLGDAIVYGFSLYVIGAGPSVAGARRAAQGRHHGRVRRWYRCGDRREAGARRDAVTSSVMSGVGRRRPSPQASVLVFLWRHRGDDLNMRSAWLCSRNDVVANPGVLVPPARHGYPARVAGHSSCGLAARRRCSALRPPRMIRGACRPAFVVAPPLTTSVYRRLRVATAPSWGTWQRPRRPTPCGVITALALGVRARPARATDAARAAGPRGDPGRRHGGVVP